MKLIEEPMTSIELKDGTVSAWVTNRWALPGQSGEPVVRTVFRSRYSGNESAVHLELSASEVDDLVILLADHKRQLAKY
jgi:hypothetical protein